MTEVLMNRPFAEKLLPETRARAVVFALEDYGAAKQLYEQQDRLFFGQKIMVGWELETAHIHVEGSSLLYDELFAYRGLGALDLGNCFLVAQYIACLKRFGWLEQVLVD